MSSNWFKKKKSSSPLNTTSVTAAPTTSQSSGNVVDATKSVPDSNGTSSSTSHSNGKHKSAADDKEPWKSLEDLEEALTKIANDPPVVARSIPKGLHLERIGDNSKIAAIQRERSLRHCLYGPEVYDHMLADTMNVCSLLQDNLDDYITQVRGNTPPDRQSTPVDSQLGKQAVAAAPVQSQPAVPSSGDKANKPGWFSSKSNAKQPPLVTTN